MVELRDWLDCPAVVRQAFARRDLAGDRIFFRVLKGSLQANGLPSFVLKIDRLEVGFQGQVVGITPSQSKGNLEGYVQGSGS